MTGTKVEGGGALGTDPRSEDPRLRGRTYAIPFDPVWEASLALAGGELRGWTVHRSDDNAGVIEAEVTSRFLGRVSAVRVRVSLDQNAQTRVDLEWRFLGRGPALGLGRRGLVEFMQALDDRLDPGPGKILDSAS